MDKTLDIELAAIRPKVLATATRFFRASRLDGDPEDVVQDALLRFWEARQNGVQIRSAEAWAVAIAKNCCISLWRKKTARKKQRASGMASGRPGRLHAVGTIRSGKHGRQAIGSHARQYAPPAAIARHRPVPG